MAIASLILLLWGLTEKVCAGNELTVAVAANFAPALQVMGERFTAETGISVQLTVSSSGTLYAQIKNKAPFDLYFSADSARPEKLYDVGICTKPILYAAGKIVLWTRNKNLCRLKDWQQVVSSPEVRNIAMAKPDLAPYGNVARETCTKSGVWTVIKNKVVYGNNVAQSFQYAATSMVDAAFISLSLAGTQQGRTGWFWEIPEARQVHQKACVMRYSSSSAEAEQFLKYVASEPMKDILQEF
ncbi:MAG: molybdate ABC transporter substrate-binding protein, partial [Desulfobulbales bacterium]